jgi:hypothetical protein
MTEPLQVLLFIRAGEYSSGVFLVHNALSSGINYQHYFSISVMLRENYADREQL